MAVASEYFEESLVHWPISVHARIERMEKLGWMTLGSGTATWGIRAWSRRNREDRVRHLMLRIGAPGLLWGTIVLLTLTARTGATMVFHTWLRSLTPSLPTTVVVTLSTSVILCAALVSIGIILGLLSLITGRSFPGFLATIEYLVVRFLYVLAWIQGHQRSGGFVGATLQPETDSVDWTATPWLVYVSKS